LGSRCPSCGTTYLPARLFCERDFAELDPDVECGPEGTIESWTVGHVNVDDEPLDRPAMLALVRLDGSDTVMMHRLVGVESPAIGMRVRATLRDDRSGSINDLEGFAPA